MLEKTDKCISVSDLNTIISATVDAIEYLPPVLGEISGIAMHGAHLYCTLKDSDSLISLIMYNYRASKFIPSNGDKVIVRGRLSYYAKNGKLSFIATSITKVGMGNLRIELEALKTKLREAGYFDESHKKKIPTYPTNVCVVTSETGAVINDIERTIRHVNQMIKLTLINTNVQGTSAVSSICRALAHADTQNYDVIILARGGGSFEELMPFNDEKLAILIYNLKTPIISAIGHAEDCPISDFVADLRANTPTAAAETIAFSVQDLYSNIISNVNGIFSSIQSKLNKSVSEIKYASNNIYYTLSAKLKSLKSTISDDLKDTYNSILTQLTEKLNNINTISRLLKENSPTNLFKQGYFKVTHNNKTISTITNLKIGNTISLYSSEGIINAEITQIIQNNKEI
ncbi:MAG: exodeoxyribonuclease VII large subunit [Christensenellaceae bacterium]|jgi:exodeoxyribonuclease VII large subunit|nr:exodeoxyribonuclease VII large subunit [Christensenellaceae bacterium]